MSVLCRSGLLLLAGMAPVLASSAPPNRPSRTSSQASAAGLLAQARTVYASGGFAEAARLLTNAILVKGPDPELYRARGDAWLKLHEWRKAYEDYQRVLALGINLPSVHGALADALVQLGRPDEAIKSYSTALNLQLDDPVRWSDRGQTYAAAGRFREALADFDQAIRLKPDFAGALARRGAVHAQNGDWKRAADDLTRAVALEPEDYQALAALGSAHSRLGDFPRAIAAYTRAIEGEPNTAALYLERASAYVALGEHEKALTDREQAVRLRPDWFQARLARGASYHQLGDHEKGFADRTEAIRLKPDSAEAWCARGNAYYLLGDYRKALSDLSRALELHPNYAEARRVLDSVRARVLEEVVHEQRSGPIVARAGNQPAEPAVTAAQAVRNAGPPVSPAPAPSAAIVRPPPAPLPAAGTAAASDQPGRTAAPAAVEIAGGDLPARLDWIAARLTGVLVTQQREEALRMERNNGEAWGGFSDRVEQVCGIVERSAAVFAEALRNIPAADASIRGAGEALTRACIVSGPADRAPTTHEQEAMEAAFSAYLGLSLAHLRSAAAQPRAADWRPPIILLSGVSVLLTAILAALLGSCRRPRNPNRGAARAPDRKAAPGVFPAPADSTSEQWELESI